MLKKRLLSFFIALTLVLTSVLPSATFASNNDVENEVVENLEEGAEEQQEEQVEEDSDKVICVSCGSENVNLVIPMLNLYTCEDCGKYFAWDGATNKKGIDEQIDAVEEDAKKNIEAGMFSASVGSNITWHFVFGTDLGTISEGLPGTVWPDYQELNWGGIGSNIDGLEHYDFLGWSKSIGGAMKENSSGVNYQVGQTYATGKVAYTVFGKHQYVMTVEGNDDTKVTYGENFVLPTDFDLEEGQEFKGWKDADGVEYAAGDTIENVERDMEFFAIVEACEYNVKVGDEDATKIAYGDTITLPEEYNDIEGKTFTGWRDQQNNVYDKGDEVIIKSNKTFTPVYDDVYYDVYVNNEKKASKKHGEEFTLPNDFEVGETEVFIGWEDEDGNTYDKGEKVALYDEKKFTPVIGSKELFTVTFDSDGGSDVEAQKVYDGLKATKPEDPEREHYNFVKWTLDGVEYNFNTKVTKDITLKATWEAKKYTINVDGVESEVAYGDKITLPTTKESTDPTKVFDDYVDGDGNHYEGGKEVEVDGPKTFTATFKEKNKVDVRYFDGATELTNLKEEVYEGFTATNKVIDDKEHYYFRGWKTSDGSEYKFEKEVTSELKLYAIWEAKKYTINVDGVESEVAYGDKITLPTTKESTDPTKVFDDYVDGNGNHYPGGKEITVDGPMTFTATFEYKDKFAVRYFDDTTELTSLKEEVFDGFKATEKTLTDKEHYLFKGWKLSTGAKYDFTKPVTSEVKLYAIWEAKKYTINVDGVESEKSYGEKFNLPTTCESDDDTKEFAYFEDEDGNHYGLNGEVEVDGPKTITAVFKEKKKYAVRYFDGATELKDFKTEMYEGGRVTSPAKNPTKNKKKFQYWADKNGNKYIFGNALTSNVDLYAVWKNVYTFRIDYNNTAAYSSSTYLQGEYVEGDTVTVTLPTLKTDFSKYNNGKNTQKGSYMFWGYAVNDNSNPKSATYKGGQKISITMNEDTTIYGVWRIDNFKGRALTLSYNGVSYRSGKGGQAKKTTRISVQYGSGYTQVYKLPDANDKAKKATSKKFKGWARSSNATTPDFKVGDLYICSGASTSNTLYAVWQ